MSEETRRVLAEDNLVIDFQYALIDALRAKGMNKDKLAKTLGVTKARISQWLSDDANPTLRTVARVFDALDYRVEFAVCDIGEATLKAKLAKSAGKTKSAKPTLGLFDQSMFVWQRQDEARNDNYSEERERIAA